MPIRLIDYRELKARGICFSKPHLWRKEKAGTFPKRVYIGAKSHGWLESEIDEWITERAASRGTEAIAHPPCKNGEAA